MLKPLQNLYKFATGTATLAALALVLVSANPATAAQSGNVSHGLGKALAASQGTSLYEDRGEGGGAFKLSGSYFSGLSSGTELSGNLFGDSLAASHSADLAGDQRVYALLIDGSYDFNHDADEALPLHPYIAGGLGMAMSKAVVGSSASLSAQDGNMVPLFRIGGGVTYRLGQKWNLSLDYKAGFTGLTASDQVFTGRGQQPIDMQSLNMGLRYNF